MSRALTLFFGEGKNFVTIKAAEKLMDRALWVAEIVRRKVEGLHQIVHITERKIVDVYEPREEGLLTVKEERYLTIMEVTLTKAPSADQLKHPGYHTPVTNKEEFLTKETWEKGEKEREERRNDRNDRRDDRRERRDDRRDRRDDRRDDRRGDRINRSDLIDTKETRSDKAGEKERRRGRGRRD